MKKLLLCLGLLIGMSAAGGMLAIASVKSRVVGQTISAKEAEKRWGRAAFDEAAFKKGPEAVRAKMAADLLAKKQLVGVPLTSVRERLGEFTGYFWNDTIPAYLLNEGWKTNEDVWQLVLLPGRDGKVGDIIINKNCCDNSDDVRK